MESSKKGQFYMVATPIGNLGDITFRAVQTLKEVDLILCEDTRHSLKLLNHLQIKNKLLAYHKFNSSKVIPKVIEELINGKNVALISDAGMPAISDPGSEILSSLIENEINYTIVPGASAVVSAVALAGMDDHFTFLGFLPEKTKDKKQLIRECKSYKTDLVFYVSPHDVVASLEFLYKELGNRKICLVKEITKLYEEVYHSTLKEGYNKPPRGEYVLIVEGSKEEGNELNNLPLKEHLEYYLNLDYSKNDAIKQIAKDKGLSKSEVYKMVVNLK